jgi:hypothetical protein
MSSEKNFYCRAGAEQLAGMIRTYWLASGYAGIETWVVPIFGKETDKPAPREWMPRSNIGPNGFPPREVLSTSSST